MIFFELQRFCSVSFHITCILSFYLVLSLENLLLSFKSILNLRSFHPVSKYCAQLLKGCVFCIYSWCKIDCNFYFFTDSCLMTRPVCQLIDKKMIWNHYCDSHCHKHMTILDNVFLWCKHLYVPCITFHVQLYLTYNHDDARVDCSARVVSVLRVGLFLLWFHITSNISSVAYTSLYYDSAWDRRLQCAFLWTSLIGVLTSVCCS